MKLTAVIYVQNASENEILTTLKSFKDSTLTDYEILILDDGSSESYKALAEKYGARYVKTEKRGKLASYLYATEIANAEYVTFVKAGSGATFSYYAQMVEAAVRENADVTLGQIAYEYEGTRFTCNEDIEGSFFCASKLFKVSALKNAKKELEKTSLTMLSADSKAEIIISLYAASNAKKFAKSYTGYAFFALSSEKTDVCALANEGAAVICELGAVCNQSKERELDARALCLLAKMQKEKGAISAVESAYGLTKIKPISKKEATQYRKIELLGDNFADIEKALRKINSTKASATVIYDMENAYERSALEAILVAKAENANEKPITLMIPKRITKKKVKLKPEQIFALVRFY